MALVNDLKAVGRNIKRLSVYLSSARSNERRTAVDLIKHGICFVVANSHQKPFLAPSRFVGYANNSLRAHRARRRKDGRQTNQALQNVLGAKPTQDHAMELLYREFCLSLGIEATPRGALPRKYWILAGNIGTYKQRARRAKTVNTEDTVSDIEQLKRRTDLSPTERRRLVQARLGQGQFRRDLIHYWKTCAVVGCARALRASHIKPWRDSSDDERLDPANGLLLSANLDAVFDDGLITFDDDGRMMVSTKVARRDQSLLQLQGHLRKKPSKRQRRYLKFHRTKKFQN